MKRLFTLLMVAMLTFGAAGCGNNSEPENTDTAMLTEEGAEETLEDNGMIIFEEDVPLTDSPESEMFHEYVLTVVDLVNKERAKENIPPVTLNTTATKAAQVRAEEAAKSFSHTRPNGTKCFTALTEANISYMVAGENLAGRIQTPTRAVQAWMESPGHRKNIMNPKFSQIGVGYVASGNYWSQFFLG